MILQNNKAFTLIEILLVIALMAILIGLSAPLFLSFRFDTELDESLRISAQSLRTAQTYSKIKYQDSEWGVRFASGTIIIFKGTSFGTRDANFDQEYKVPSTVVFTGITTIYFSKISAVPNTTGTITLSGSSGSKSININAKGRLTY